MSKKLPNAPVPDGHMSSIEKAFISYVMLKLGIVPIDDLRLDVQRSMKNTPPAEARAMKRKFRKLWRKLSKEQKKAVNKRAFYVEPGKVPSSSQRSNRKNLVYNKVWETMIAPLISSFRNPQNDEPKEEA